MFSSGGDEGMIVMMCLGGIGSGMRMGVGLAMVRRLVGGHAGGRGGFREEMIEKRREGSC